MENRPVPSPNAYDYYLAACEAMVDKELPESRSAGCTCQVEQREITLEEKSAIVERNSAALQKLREGFEHEFLVPEEVKSYPSEVGAFYVSCRWLAKLLQMESEVLLANCNPAEAVSSLLDIIRLGSDLPRGGLLMDALVGRAIEMIGLARAWELVDQVGADHARDLAHRAGALCRSSWPFAETLKEEKRSGCTALAAQCAKRFWKLDLAGECTSGEGQIAPYRALFHILPLSRKAVLSDYDRYMDEQISLARMPYSVAEQEPEVAGNYVSRCLGLDARSGVTVLICNGVTQKVFLAVALALRAYRLDQGAYPGDLSELVPGCFSALPNDPFAEDAPLRYRINGDRYILYSVGPDGVDDGGKPIFDPETELDPGDQNRVRPNSKGDIVAGVNW